jgi:hypothetical protein
MQTAGCLTVEIDLMFPTAAVGFTVNIGPERAAEGVPLRIRPRALVEGKTARFAPEASYPLADFVGGFCRWLGTKRVTAAHTEEEITAHFQPHYTVLQMLGTLQELCQMLEDKFGAYPHSILV